MHIDAAILSPISPLLGALAIGGATLSAAIYTHRCQNRLQRIAAEIAKREAVYADFVMSASNLLLHAFTHDAISPSGDEQRLIGLINRMRLFAPPEVIRAAEAVLRSIVEIALRPSVDLRQLAKEALSENLVPDPLQAFSEICRADLDSVREERPVRTPFFASERFGLLAKEPRAMPVGRPGQGSDLIMPDDVLLVDRPSARSRASRRNSHGGWPTWAAPLAALALAGLEHAHLLDAETVPFLLAAALLLIGSVFAAVHHAEVVARKVGEPYGSILLALAVTAIETSLIVTTMVSGGPGENSLARDTVFSVVLIVLNGVVLRDGSRCRSSRPRDYVLCEARPAVFADSARICRRLVRSSSSTSSLVCDVVVGGLRYFARADASASKASARRCSVFWRRSRSSPWSCRISRWPSSARSIRRFSSHSSAPCL